MLSNACFYLIDNIFFRQVEVQFPDEVALAGFLGLYMAVLQLVTLMSSLFLAARLIDRLGMRAGLLVTPLFTGLIALAFAISGIALVPSTILFALATLNSIVDWSLRDTVYQSSLLVLLQPLPPAQRSRLQTQMESIAMPKVWWGCCWSG